nr:AMP-binding protein [Brevibacterium daeguense]
MSPDSARARQPGADLAELLRGALQGEHTVVLPRDRSGDVRLAPPQAYEAAGTDREAPALVVFTSGSTGRPKGVALSAAALTASARATERHLSGPGRWHLALPTNHIAGAQVVLRSLLAGTAPLQSVGRFTAASFTADVARLQETTDSGVPLYGSLVPTQLVRVMADSDAMRAAAALDAILLGGAAISPALLRSAAAVGLRIVRTYGMSETCGGCVYDGHPFDEVELDITADGLVRLTGAVVADGYVEVTDTGSGPVLRALPDAGTGFGTGPAGRRSFLTSDLGRISEGVLEILGRADDVIITGGENVSPLAVEAVLLRVLEASGAAEVLVTSVPDPEWGERIVALVRPAGGELAALAAAEPDPVELARWVRVRTGTALPRYEQPAAVLPLTELPMRSIGKPDRTAARRLAADRLGAGLRRL